MRGADPMMRGDPRGISGRLNGGVNDPSMWGQPPQPPHHNMPHHQQSQPPRVGPGVGSGGNFPGGKTRANNVWANNNFPSSKLQFQELYALFHFIFKISKSSQLQYKI